MQVNENLLNNNPFFSIVLPIYGVEKYLDRCINSIVDQEFKNYEIILVDDGSKDKCPEICERWKSKDERIKVIHKENEGLGLARNSGLDIAEGKYVLFIDSDDYILPGLLSELYKKIVHKNSDIIFYGFERIDSKGKCVLKSIPRPDKKYYSGNENIRKNLLPDFFSRNPYTGESKNLRISAWNCCISIDFLRKNKMKFVSERKYICEDVYFYLEIFDYINSVEFIDKVYYCYCQNSGSLTFSYKENRYERLKNFYMKADELIKEKKYVNDVAIRIHAQFIGNTIGCLKMEAANGIKKNKSMAKKKIISICEDMYFKECVNKYPNNALPYKWKIIFSCINKRRYNTLMILLLFQYMRNGV